MSKSGNTGQSGKGSSDSSKNQKSGSNNESGKSSSAREFIYLDIPKISSYLSQIQNGLSLLVQRVESAYGRTETAEGGDATTVKSGAEAEIAAELGALGKAGVGFSLNRDRTTNTATRNQVDAESASSQDLTVLHHKAFDIVMEQLENKFVVQTGNTLIFPIGDFVNVLKDQIGFGENSVTALQLLGDFGVDCIAYVENERKNVHAFLSPDYFTIPPIQFISAYGAPAQVEFTIVGLYSYDPRKTGTRMKQIAGGQMGQLVKQFGEAFDPLHTLLGTNTGTRLYPLAIYRSLSRD